MLRKEGYIDPSSPDNYHQNSSLQFDMACRFIDESGKYIKGPVLDIGCGDGRVTAYIAEKFGCDVVGVDISSDRVEFANANYKHDKRLHFVAGNAVCLDSTTELAGKQFQTIVSFNALHHIPRHLHSSVFENISSKLSDNGCALLLIPKSQEVHKYLAETVSSAKWKAYFSDFDINAERTYEGREYYAERCSAARLTGTFEEDDIAGREGLDFDAMKKHLAGWLPHLAHLKLKQASAEIIDEFLNDVVSRFFKAHQKQRDEKILMSVMQNKLTLFAMSKDNKPEQKQVLAASLGM